MVKVCLRGNKSSLLVSYINRLVLNPPDYEVKGQLSLNQFTLMCVLLHQLKQETNTLFFVKKKKQEFY